ncbi:10255_t:CDS:2 [Funneliformis caledonium]|uniref:10255_t:CDS:1 n=1 Tax=Funneliformis caledonium TaxID=1117310 RepID=A0A9N9I7W5_9GLOM|nr:10255_t:CDS:2 [Funneliformis caledonium]
MVFARRGGKYNKIEKVFKKGETKPDGTVVSADAGETIKLKVNEIENLLNERDELITDLTTKQTILKVKSGYLRPFAEISLQHDKLEPTIAEYKTNLTTGKNYTNQYNNNYTKQKFTPPYTGATPQEYTNLYDINLYSGGGHQQKRVKMIESELIKLITLTLKEYEKIDTTTAGETFNDYLTTKKPSGVTVAYETGDNATKVNG